MAVLAERVIQQEAAPGLAAWHFHGFDPAWPTLTTTQDDVKHEQQLHQSHEPYELRHDIDEGLDYE